LLPNNPKRANSDEEPTPERPVPWLPELAQDYRQFGAGEMRKREIWWGPICAKKNCFGHAIKGSIFCKEHQLPTEQSAEKK